MKKLYRSYTNKRIWGVCGGIGEYFNVDASIIRLGWIVASLLTGLFPGVIAYAVAAMLIPKHETESAMGHKKQAAM